MAGGEEIALLVDVLALATCTSIRKTISSAPATLLKTAHLD
jgi:hypothetical protein